MPDEVKPNPKQATTQDAQLAAEEIASGEEKATTVNVEGDYEASKQYSASEIDRSGAGTEAAEKITAPDFEVPKKGE